jgi:hypothetical protein
MNFTSRFVWRAILLTGLLIVAMAYPLKWWLGDSTVSSVVIGGCVSAVVVSISFSALTWSFDKSNRTFMITYVAGFLGRMLALCGAILVINAIDSLNLIAGSLAILIVYLALTAMEIKFVGSYRSST